MKKSALVLFSGGQDSTTCLVHALDKYDRVETLAIQYGQRHAIELQCRLEVLQHIKAQFPQWAIKLGEDVLLDFPVLGEISATALTQNVALEMQANGVPNTFVPGRNLLFLTMAASIAYRRGLEVIVTGVCETDFSGYPDCRDNTIKAQQVAISLGLARDMVIETPLMWLNKAQTWQLAQHLGGKALVNIILEHTHTCYLGDRSVRHEWGYGCGDCFACVLRKRGYQKFSEGKY